MLNNYQIINKFCKDAFFIWFCIFLTSCNGSGGSNVSATAFSVDVNISGLDNGQSFAINTNYNSQVSSATINANGQISLVQSLTSGTNYNITIPTQPQNEKCAVTNGQGQIIDSNVSVQIICSSNLYALSGTVSGLEPGETVTLYNADQTTSHATIINNTQSTFQNKNFDLNESAPYLGSYNIQVLSQPQNQICSVDQNTGVIYGNISNISVYCNRSSYPVAVKYIGTKLVSQNIVLVNRGNTADTVSINATNRNAQFKTLVPLGKSYNVTIQNKPSNYSCKFLNANSGDPIDANATPVVEVSCIESSNYYIGGNVTGLASGEGVTISTNNHVTNPNYTITANGAYTYPNSFSLGESYIVTISHQPQTQHCTLTSGSGIISGNVTNVNFSCSYETGQLIPLNPNKFSLPTSVMPYAIAVTHDNKYAYVVDSANSQVIMFKINGNGTLSPLPQYSVFTYNSPVSIAVSSDDKYVYVVSTGQMMPNGVIFIYAINLDGSLTPVQDSYPFIMTGLGPSQISLTPNDKYVYVVNGLNNVSMYNVESGGSNLANMIPSTVPAGNYPQSMIISSDNKYAYVLNSGSISMYSISSTGMLESLTPSTILTGNNPYGIAITKDNKFVYLTNSHGDGDIYIYSVGVNGVLTKISQVNNLGVVPYTVTLSPDGNYLYVMTYPDNNQVYMLTFTINHNTGDLIPLQYMSKHPLQIKGSLSTTTDQIVVTTTNLTGNNYVYIIGSKNIYMYSIYNP